MTIFDYVMNNIDDNGKFTAATLPDDPAPAVPRPLGTEDAYYYTTEVPPDVEGADRALELVKQYMVMPCLESRRRLYDHICSIITAGICDPFLDGFPKDEFTPELLKLARELFYGATNREPVKFAYLLFGLYGMERLHDADEKLWHDMVSVARCEEFTFFFLYACRITEYAPQQEIWQLIHCTNSWGRVYAINEASFETPAKRQWLVENGYDITIEYPPLSVKIITEGHVAELLKGPQITYEEYKGIGAALNNLLLLLNNFSADVLEENFTISLLDVNGLLTDFLGQAQHYADTPANILDVLAISMSLRNMAEMENWSRLTANQCHTLIAACDKIVYHKDWQAEIDAELFKDGKVNYTMCDFGFELEMDLWPKLFAYFKEHPLEINLLPYLLSYEGEERSKQVLDVVERNLYSYLPDQNALLIPLRYLRHHPGEGVAIVIAALTSLYDWPRGIACTLLEEWGHQYLTTPIRSALLTARSLCQHPVVNARIDDLLAGGR